MYDITDKIRALFCKKCGDIIYSRGFNDEVKCSCGRNKITTVNNLGDTIEYRKRKHIEEIEINSLFLLGKILYYDKTYGNSNSGSFPTGYHGRFKIVEDSSPRFYKGLLGDDFSKIAKKFYKITGGNNESLEQKE